MINCIQCGFWQEQANTKGVGICRRHAPCPIVGPSPGLVTIGTHKAAWPYTRDLDGCGEGMIMQQRPIADQNEAGDTLANLNPKTTEKPSFQDMVNMAKNKTGGRY